MSSNSSDIVIGGLEHQAKALNAQVSHIESIGEEKYYGSIFEDMSKANYVVLTASGKSAHLADKISASLASTGTPSYFEMAAGDCGSIPNLAAPDRVLAIATGEDAVDTLRRVYQAGHHTTPVDVITQLSPSLTLKGERTVLSVVDEYNDGLDTTEHLIAMALGDSLLCGLQSLNHFTAADFVKDHPKGALGSSIASQQAAGESDDIDWHTPSEAALKGLKAERDGIVSLKKRTAADRKTVEKFVAAMASFRHRIITTGMGKPGYCCRYMASLLNENNIPAFALDPAEGVHGDLGRIVKDTVTICYSHSGETAEMMGILPRAVERGTKLLALTNSPDSSLGQKAEITLFSGADEVDPIGKAPTGSTTATVALMNGLVAALIDY